MNNRVTIILLIGFFAFSFLVVVVRNEINRSGRTVSALQNEVEIKEARNQYLQLEISRMQSPENITKLAEEKLKLKPIKPHKVIILED